MAGIGAPGGSTDARRGSRWIQYRSPDSAMVAATAGRGWNARLVANAAAVSSAAAQAPSGEAGAARARPGPFARCVERALAPPPLGSSSISASSCGVQTCFSGFVAAVSSAVCRPAQAPSGWQGRPARGLAPLFDVWSAHWRRCRSVPAQFQRARVWRKAFFLGVWPPCHLQYAGLPSLPRAGGDGPRAACNPCPVHGARIGVAAVPFQLGLISRLGCMAIFWVCGRLSVDNQYRLQLLIRLPRCHWGSVPAQF